jgi:diacylglycerol kinase family enzyme
MRGRHLERRETTYRQVKSVRIRGVDRELPYHIDGEGGFARVLDIQVLPGCLRTVHGPV